MSETPESPPFPLEEIEPIAQVMGLFVQLWAYIDQNLDYWTGTIYHRAGGNQIETELPRNFSRKCRFLRECFKQIELLSIYRDECLKMIDHCEEISKIRQFIIHGTIYKVGNGSIHFRKLDVPRPRMMHHEGKLEMSYEEFTGTAVNLIGFHGMMLQVSHRLLNTLPTKNNIHNKPSGS